MRRTRTSGSRRSSPPGGCPARRSRSSSWPCATPPTTSACWPLDARPEGKPDQPAHRGRSAARRRHAGATRRAARNPGALVLGTGLPGLAQGSVLEHILEQAREHTDQALRGTPSADLHLLAGRIALEQGRLEDAGHSRPPRRRESIAPSWRRSAPRWRSSSGATGTSPASRRNARRHAATAALRGPGEILDMTEHTAPTAPVADVCLLLEGTWPYVRGGVSSWVNQLILGLPDLTFSVFFIGGQKDAYGKRHYPIPDNVLHIEEHFLETAWSSPNPQARQGSSETEKALRDLHRFFHYPETPDVEEGDALLDLLAEGRIGREDFLHSKASWEAITAGYERYCTDPSFVNYFWTLRSMQAPVFMLAEAARRMPRARMLHSISTGYAGLLGCILQRRWGCRYLLSEHGIYQGAQDRPGPGQLDRGEPRRAAEYRTGCRGQLHPSLVDPLLRACRPAHLSRRQSDRRPLRRQPPAPGTRWRRATAHPGDPQRHRPRCLGRRPRTAAAGDSAGGRAGRPGSADQDVKTFIRAMRGWSARCRRRRAGSSVRRRKTRTMPANAAAWWPASACRTR